MWLCSVALVQGTHECSSQSWSKPWVRDSLVLEGSLEGQTALQREMRGIAQAGSLQMTDPQQWRRSGSLKHHKNTMRNIISSKPLPSTKKSNTRSLQWYQSSKHISDPLPSLSFWQTPWLAGCGSGHRRTRRRKEPLMLLYSQKLREMERPQDFKPTLVFQLLLGMDIPVMKWGL